MGRDVCNGEVNEEVELGQCIESEAGRPSQRERERERVRRENKEGWGE
jgi:hypothetical protein